MDPALRELLRDAEQDPDATVETIVRFRHRDAVVPGVTVVARFGTIATCRIRAGDVVDVRSHPLVVSCKAARPLGPDHEARPANEMPDSAADRALELRPTDGRRPPGLPLTGRGVVVGALDWGLDFAAACFRRPDGRTRLLGLFDQRDHPGVPPALPYGYGTIHTPADIDAALTTDHHPYRTLGYHPADADQGNGSHGTHVLDIAAGNGRSGGPLGVACDADLVFVHLADRDTGGLANLGDSVRLLEAVDYVRRTAAGRPWVVNLSVGRHGGPHDGSTLIEMALDELLDSTPGCFVGQSAGNYFRADTHASGVVPDGGTRTLRFSTHPADTTLNELEIWYAGADRFIVDLTPPGASAGVEVRLGASADIVVDGTVVGRLYHRAYDPNDGDHLIDGFLYPSAPAGTWTVTLRGERVVDGRYHAWLERDQACPKCQARFRPSDAASTTTTGTLANGHLPLVVGAYDGHRTNRPLAHSSSSGPTRDERPKPDLIACGVDVLAARSAPAGSVASPDLLIRKSGTSMATPHVTGAAALCLQAGGTSLDASRIRSLILTTTRPAGSAYDPRRVGHGFLDLHALGAALCSGPFDLPTAKELAMTISPSSTESPNAAVATAPDSSLDPLAVLASTPARAYREFLYRPDGPFSKWMAERFTVLARPGEPLSAPSSAGDVLLGAVLGTPRGGDCRVLTTTLDLGRMRVLPAGRLLLRPRMDGVYAADTDELAEDAPDHIAVSYKVWRGLGLPRDVKIRDLKELPNQLLRTFISANQIAAWTNSPHDVYVTQGLADEDFAHAVLYHEAIHIRQFRAHGDRTPPSYAHMMRYECDAYRESAKWTSGHARAGVRGYASDLEKSARKFCDEITAAVAARLSWETLNARYKRFLVSNRFLPEHDFPITDLYRAVRPQAAEDQPGSRDLELLLREGLPENDITDALFFARHPGMTRTAIRRGSAQAREWTRIRDTDVRPAVRRALVVQPADPVELAVFLSQYEGDSRVPAAATRRFLTEPVLLSLGRSLRDRVLAHWRNGGRPLTPLRFYELAFELAGHAATATLLCHNVAKAFSRSGTAITWSNLVPEGTYTDGQHTYTAAVIHPSGQLRYRDQLSGREKTSIFYLLFSAKEFGTADPSDWYHFFITATMCAHGSSGALTPGTRRSREEDGAEQRGGTIGPVFYEGLVANRIADLERQMTVPALRGVPGYRGWVLANALSFLEGGYYGKDYVQDQTDVERESRVHLRGAVFGLQTIGGTPGPAWRWYVPKARTISKIDLALGIDVRAVTAALWRADGTTFSEELEAANAPDEAEGLVSAMDAESPAFIAVAGTLISATQLGIAVFDRLESHLLRGAFSVDAAPATYIHDPSPLGLTVRTRVFSFPVTAFHPRGGFGTETFWFTVTLEYDGFNIRRASIVEDRSRSSTLVSSDFSITFTPSRYTATNEPVTAIVYNIKGRWDPIGRGDESFDGAFRLDAAGNFHALQVNSPRNWVRAGKVTQMGGGPVPRPTKAIHQTDVHFDRAGSARLSQAGIRHIYDWFRGLPSPVQAEIRAGSLPIQLTGRASTTGTIERNQQLARQRADAVAAVLRDLAGSRAAITVSAHDELGARTPDGLEDPAERRVEITCEYQVYRI